MRSLRSYTRSRTRSRTFGTCFRRTIFVRHSVRRSGAVAARGSGGSAAAARGRGATGRSTTAGCLAAATMVTMVTMVATAVATTAAVAAGVTSTAAVTSDRRTRTADQGDSDDREKDRESNNQCAIHPRILQLLLVLCRNSPHNAPSNPRDSRLERPAKWESHNACPTAFILQKSTRPPCKLYRLRKQTRLHRLGR
jgi:hypothetical protein